MKKLILTFLTSALVVAACSSPSVDSVATNATTTTLPPTTLPPTTLPPTTLPPTTTTTISAEAIAAIEYESDVKLIKSMWRTYSDSWWEGVASGYDTSARFDHPMLDCTAEDFVTGLRWDDGDKSEIIVDASTIERDDEWTTTDSDGNKRAPEGRVYIMTVDIIYNWSDGTSDQTKAEVHSTVDGNNTFFFIDCR